MKKNILIALFALLAVALNGNAQNNTYNMVIEMVNGSKITIGPNDVKNISFNNGELVITGENINTLVEQQSKADERIESLAKTVDGLSAQLADALKQVQDYFNRVYSKDQVDALLKDVQSGSTPDLSNYAEKKDVATVQTHLASVQQEIAYNTAALKDQINAAQKGNIDYVNNLIEQLEAKITENQNQIGQNKAALQKEIADLREWVKVLDSIVSANQ